MVKHLLVVIWKLSVVVFVTADFDKNFCMQQLGPVKDSKKPTGPDPPFPDNFHVFTEMKDVYYNRTVNQDVYYSMENDMAFFLMTSAARSEKVWVFGKTDELIEGPFNDVCEEEALENSTLASFLGAIDLDGKIELNKPEKSFHWDLGTERRDYIGTDVLSDRGIPVMIYKSCEYWDKMATTSVTTWFFSDPSNVTMPGRGKEAVLLATEIMWSNDNIVNVPAETPQYNIRYDFTSYTTGVEKMDKHFELPAENLCTDRPYAKVSHHPLPEIPGDFFFQGEQTNLDRNGDFPYPTIHKVGEAFISDFNMSVSRVEGVIMGANPDTAKSVQVTVSDFENGLQYMIDMVQGTCEVDIISADDEAAVDLGNGKLRMRTASGFFDLDSDKYEYMGVHRHIERGIDCDVWSAYFDDTPGHEPKALYTWYFTNPDWMKANSLEFENPFPVQLVVTKAEEIITLNMFEFTRNVLFHIPDVSSCFNSALEQNVQFTLDGRYDHVILPNLLEFRGSLMETLLYTTGIKSPIRISELEFYPEDWATVVQFKMLDKRPQQGDVDNHIHITTNKVAIQSLKTAIDTGKFVVQIQEDYGLVKIQAVKDSFQIIEPQGVTTTLSPRSGTTSPMTPGAGSESPVTPAAGGKSGNPDSNANTGNSDADTELYTPGEMAGLAVGMIVLTGGIILLALFIVSRLKKPQTTSEYVDMEKIES